MCSHTKVFVNLPEKRLFEKHCKLHLLTKQEGRYLHFIHVKDQKDCSYPNHSFLLQN